MNLHVADTFIKYSAVSISWCLPMSTERFCELCSKPSVIVVKISGTDVCLCEDHWRELCQLMSKVAYVKGNVSLNDIVIVENGKEKKFKVKYDGQLIDVVPKLRASSPRYLLKPEEIPENYFEIISET